MAVLYGLIANLAINEQIDQQIVNKNIDEVQMEE